MTIPPEYRIETVIMELEKVLALGSNPKHLDALIFCE